jgi:chromosome segregation ATPase
MGWFHKKDKVPELPPANLEKGIREPPKKENSELPSLPKNLGAGLNREIVKSAVHDETIQHNSAYDPSEEDSGSEMIPSIPTEPEKKSSQKNSLNSEGKPLFVRIDSFQEAKSDFSEINKKIKSIESSIKKFNDVKMKEDNEIAELNKDLGFVKEKISKIDGNIFEKI